HNNLGNAHLTLGEYLLTRGLDPRGALDRAAVSYRHAIELKPDYYLARYNLGYTWRPLGEALLDQRQDPRPALDQAASALDAAARLNPTDADLFLEQARVKLLAGRWHQREREGGGAAPRRACPQRQRQDAGPARRAADAELARAEALNPQQPDVFFTEGLVARCRAEGTTDSAARTAALREGLDRVARALALNAGEGAHLAPPRPARYTDAP